MNKQRGRIKLTSALALGLGALLGFAGCGARAPEATAAGQVEPAGAGGVDLSGHSFDPLAAANGKPVVLLFLGTECPISNRYAPEIRRLHAAFAPLGVTFWLVYPEAEVSADAVHRHLQEHELPASALRDPQHALVRRARARVTPEAAVFSPDGRLAYHGRIDDQFVELGVARTVPASHDLRDAVQAVLDGRPVARAVTRAVGCSIADPK